MKIRRRHLLLGGLTLGVTARGLYQEQQYLADTAYREALEAIALNTTNPQALISAAFVQEQQAVQQVAQVRNSRRLVSPTIPYNRHISRQLIWACRVATEQYVVGKTDTNYGGAINVLPSYSTNILPYRQVGSFLGTRFTQDTHTLSVDLSLATTQELIASDSLSDRLKSRLHEFRDHAQHTVKLTTPIPVYFGFALISKTANVMIFRGTQRQNEAIQDLLAAQDTLEQIAPAYNQGEELIHVGFLLTYLELAAQIRKAAEHFDPNLPCYIAGHSLGGALATLAAFDLANRYPKMRPNLRLYTYASPRVGNVAFANTHSQLIPNSYRIYNVADTVPKTPATTLTIPILGKQVEYVHMGQPWSFVIDRENVGSNHLIDTYRIAIDSRMETRSQ